MSTPGDRRDGRLVAAAELRGLTERCGRGLIATVELLARAAELEKEATADRPVTMGEVIGAKDDTPRAAPDGYLPPVELSRDRLGELLEQAAQLGIDAPAPVDLTAKGIAGTLLAEQLRGVTPEEQP